jgi:predicted DNA-binding protein with PD1-like motif
LKVQRALIIIALLTLMGQFTPVIAQPSFTEVVKPTTTEDDLKPNSDIIPEVIPIRSGFEEIVIFRFKYKTDLLQGLEESAAENGIQNAVFLSVIGSAWNFHIHSVSNSEFPSKNIYVKDLDSPADLTSINGYIFEGRLHAAITSANGVMTTCFNGVNELSGPLGYDETIMNPIGKLAIGGRMDHRNWFNGYTKTLMVTHTALDSENFIPLPVFSP